MSIIKYFYYFFCIVFYVAFNTVQVISRRVVGRAEETSTYSSSGFCTVKFRPMASNYQLSHLRPCREPNLGLRGGRRESYHSATVAPAVMLQYMFCLATNYHRVPFQREWEQMHKKGLSYFQTKWLEYCVVIHGVFVVVKIFCICNF